MRNSGDVFIERSVVHLVEEDAGESDSLFVRIELELRMDLDNEGENHCGEQTSLSREPAPINEGECKTHKYQCRVQVLVMLSRELPVVLFGILVMVSIKSRTDIPLC